MHIRKFVPTDVADMYTLFFDSVHKTCSRDYSIEQLRAWAPPKIDLDEWVTRFESSFTIVAEIDSSIVGFANLTDLGVVDMMYVSTHHQRQNIAQTLFSYLESQARIMKIPALTVDSSITARPFFEKMGFNIERVYSKHYQNEVFQNTLMTKSLL